MSDFKKVAECLYRYVPTGTYYARFVAHGREVRHSLKTTDRALAKRRLEDLRTKKRRTGDEGKKITLASLCDLYVSTIQDQKPKTIYRKTAIATRIKTEWPAADAVPISKVVQSDVSAWLGGYKFGVASYNLHLMFIRDAFKLAVANHFLEESPAAGLKLKKPDDPIRKTPTLEEFQAIVADIRGMRHNPDAHASGDFVEFIGLAGLGQAEAIALTWGDIDWKNETITTFRQKTKSGFVVPIFPQLRPLLERMREDCGGSPPAGEKVFQTLSAKKAIMAACRRLSLPHYSHRSFRRMFITRALELGVDVKVVSEWQGHKDGGKLILDTYSHVSRGHSARMAKLMQ